MKIKNLLRHFTLFAFIGLLINGCSDSKKINKFNPAFTPYISAYTSGTISREDPIIIRLTESIADADQIGIPEERSLFEFDPDIKGHAEWMDRQTIAFYPADDLPSGKFYDVGFSLGEIMKVADSLAIFPFQFQTIPQSFEVVVSGLESVTDADPGHKILRGTLYTADAEENELVEKTLTAKYNGNKIDISWEHAANRKNHAFSILGIMRTAEQGKLTLEWNGKSMGADLKGEQEITIPRIGEFIVTNFTVVNDPDQYVNIEFSDPVDAQQDLRGLIRLGELYNLQYIIENNFIRIHPSSRLSGSYMLTIETGVRNNKGKKLEKAAIEELNFEEVKPAVRLVGNGVIIPQSQGLIFPFEAVNLSAVDVTVTQVYENNILQFLQVNNLEGNSQLKRVGKVIKKKTIQLNPDNPLSLNQWRKYGIQLDDLIETQQGAIYQVKIGFRKEHSLYTCASEGDADEETTVQPILEETENWESYSEEDESSYWDYWDEYWYYDYSYGSRNDPCHVAYYNGSRSISRNVLASNIGLTAKISNDGSLACIVTNLISTDPIANATIEIYDFQQQLTAQSKTDSKGMTTFSLDKKPFVVVAKYGEQRGYLKLDENASLMLSRFDVSGAASQKGIKGYLYGERGVWRPGDSLYLSFILEDKQNTLPPNHPVIFELDNARGQTVYKTVKSESENNFYPFRIATNNDAPTGNWLARIRVGGSVFTKSLKVETIKPNRLKIRLDFGKEMLSVGDMPVIGTLEAKWLHGAIAKNLNAAVEVTLSQAKTTFKGYTDFVFDDPSRKFYSDQQTIFEGTLDAQGLAKIPTDIKVENAAPGMLNAHFNARVFEKGGDFSVDRFSMPYSPYEKYIGLKLPKGDKARGMLLTDTNHVVQIVALSEAGKLVNTTLEVKLYKLNWNWWWEQSDDDLTSYLGRINTEAMQIDTVSTQNGKANWKLRVNYPEWGRYLVQVTDMEGGHATGQVVFIDWPGWAGRGQKDNPGGAAMLAFSAEKETYIVGEQIDLTIPSSKGGRALISIETGSRIIRSFWAETSDKETRVNFTATSEMAPNIYVNVSLIQPHSQTENDLPIRLYGIIPIVVEDPTTHLSPMIAMADVLRPESNNKVTVSEASGLPMTYTLAIVDEGLLDLTRFATPDPWNHFYAKEALGVKTWDLYDMVLGAYTGKLERLLAIGGGDDAAPIKGAKANRFKPMVRYMGPYTLKKGEKKVHDFDIGQYVGSVRVMVVAGNKGAYGKVDKAVPVRKPLMILATLPRVLGPGEILKLPVSVFAMEKHVKNVTVEVITGNSLSLKGNKTKTIQFSNIGEETIEFDLEVMENIGIGKVRIKARSGNETAEQEIEIDIRNPNPVVTDILEGEIAAGKTWESVFELPGMQGTNTCVVEVSSVPPMNLAHHLDYLIRYPHGCVEQTTSSVFPQLLVLDLIELKPSKKREIENNIKAGIEKLRNFQKPNGGLSYWPGIQSTDDWSTTYAGHFMLEAEKKGFQIPSGFLDKWKKYQKKLAREWVSQEGNQSYSWLSYGNPSELIQAYRLYTLALAGSPEIGAMNQLKEKETLSLASKWRLAAAYALAGQTDIAKQMTKNLSTVIPPYKENRYTYGTDLRDRAMVLETLSLIGEKERARPIVNAISANMISGNWYSTQTTAYCLIGMSKYVGGTNAQKMEFEYRVNGGNGQSLISQSPFSQVELTINEKASNKFLINNKGTGELYARIILKGQPLIGEESDKSSNLLLEVVYRDMSGEIINPARLEQGTDFMAEVTIKNPGNTGNYDQMALTQIFPSGWEIINTRMDGIENLSAAGNKPEYQDIRDDRVSTYFDIAKGQIHLYRILLNASYLGKYYLPAVSAEAMYDETIFARVAGQWVEVVTPGSISAMK